MPCSSSYTRLPTSLSKYLLFSASSIVDKHTRAPPLRRWELLLFLLLLLPTSLSLPCQPHIAPSAPGSIRPQIPHANLVESPSPVSLLMVTFGLACFPLPDLRICVMVGCTLLILNAQPHTLPIVQPLFLGLFNLYTPLMFFALFVHCTC